MKGAYRLHWLLLASYSRKARPTAQGTRFSSMRFGPTVRQSRAQTPRVYPLRSISERPATNATWISRGTAIDDGSLGRYVIYRSTDGRNFRPVGIQVPGLTRFADFLGQAGQKAWYKVAASDQSYRESPPSSVVQASTRPFDDNELLTMVEEACFRYYWESAGPHSGMARENIPGNDRIIATGASGFGIMAIVVGVNRGFISREQGTERLTKIVNFLERAPRYHGAWSHFMDDSTGASLLHETRLRVAIAAGIV
jgi:hypothetical protein